MMVGHRTSSRVSENPCGPAEILHCPHLTGFCWQLDGNMENAKWRTLLFDLRGGYGLYVHCVEALLTSVCANSTHLKSENFIAKRFVYGKNYIGWVCWCFGCNFFGQPIFPWSTGRINKDKLDPWCSAPVWGLTRLVTKVGWQRNFSNTFLTNFWWNCVVYFFSAEVSDSSTGLRGSLQALDETSWPFLSRWLRHCKGAGQVQARAPYGGAGRRLGSGSGAGASARSWLQRGSFLNIGNMGRVQSWSRRLAATAWVNWAVHRLMRAAGGGGVLVGLSRARGLTKLVEFWVCALLSASGFGQGGSCILPGPAPWLAISGEGRNYGGFKSVSKVLVVTRAPASRHMRAAARSRGVLRFRRIPDCAHAARWSP